MFRRSFLVHAGVLFGFAGPAFSVAARASPDGKSRRAFESLRAADLRPSWFTSANWANKAYDPWTDYLAGQMPDDDFLRACAKTTDYCLRDIWNLRQRGDPHIQWPKVEGFNWNGVHALAVRYYRSGDPVYLDRWVKIVLSYGEWSVQSSRDRANPVFTGTPASLLDAAMSWGGIFTAMAIVCKGLRPPDAGALTTSPFSPVTAPLDDAALALVPPGALSAVAGAFANSTAPQLAKWYGQPNYIPNQRVFGLEALAYLVSCFPETPGVDVLATPMHAAIADAMTRYRLPDGGQLEQSFNYAEAIIAAARRISGLRFASGDIWRADAEATISGWNRMAAALATPSGGLPQLGNAAWGRVGRDVPVTSFSATSFAFPFSGHYVQRSEWSPNAAYLYFFHRRAARGHSMAGSNSLQLAAFGQPLLIAGGPADYRAATGEKTKSARYLDEASSWKTNTVLVDQQSQAAGDTDGLPTDASGKPDILRAPLTPIHNRWLASDVFDFLEGTHKSGYGTGKGKVAVTRDVLHRRQIAFVRPLKAWIVVDRLVTPGAHQYCQVWKFAPPQGMAGVQGFEKEHVVTDRKERCIRAQRGDNVPNIALHQFGVDVEYESHFGGDFGWFSPGATSNAVPAVDVHAVWRGRGPQTLLTLIVPYQGSKSPIDGASERSAHDGFQCEADFADGSRLAAAVPAGPPQSTAESGRLELLVTLTRPGKPKAELRIAEESSTETVGARVRRIGYPATLSWKADGATLTPSYVR